MKEIIMSERAKQANLQELAGWMLDGTRQTGMDGFQDIFCQLLYQLLSCPDDDAIMRKNLIHYMSSLYYRRLIALELLEISDWRMRWQINTMTKSILKHGGISFDAVLRRMQS